MNQTLKDILVEITIEKTEDAAIHNAVVLLSPLTTQESEGSGHLPLFHSSTWKQQKENGI